jgi:hypothetical protein
MYLLAPHETADFNWRKATRSVGQGACVEVADTGSGVAVRHFKNPDGLVLCYTREEWAAFLAGVKAGEFDDLC